MSLDNMLWLYLFIFLYKWLYLYQSQMKGLTLFLCLLLLFFNYKNVNPFALSCVSLFSDSQMAIFYEGPDQVTNRNSKMAGFFSVHVTKFELPACISLFFVDPE